MVILYSWFLGFVAGGLAGAALVARAKHKRHEEMSEAVKELETAVHALMLETGVVWDAAHIVTNYEKGREND
jgi:hypothetical protein